MKTKFNIGDRVMINPDNDNENYEKYRNKELIITHKATSEEEHRGYDSAMEGMGLYDLKVAKTSEEVPFSLYDYELIRSGGLMAGGGVIENSKANEYTTRKETFRGNNLHAENVNGKYVVYSYFTYPLFVYDPEKNQWYGNSEKYSTSTSTHYNQAKPKNVDILPQSTFNIEQIIGVTRKMEHGASTNEARVIATGKLTGNSVRVVEERGYEFVKGDLVKNSEFYTNLVGIITGSKAERLLGSGVTIRKKEMKKGGKITEDILIMANALTDGVAGETTRNLFGKELEKWDTLSDRDKQDINKQIKITENSIFEYLNLRFRIEYKHNSVFYNKVKEYNSKQTQEEARPFRNKVIEHIYTWVKDKDGDYKEVWNKKDKWENQLKYQYGGAVDEEKHFWESHFSDMKRKLSDELAKGERSEDNYEKVIEWIERQEYGVMKQFAKGGQAKTKYVGYAKGGKLCPVGTEVQTLIFSKDKFTKVKAKIWAKKNNFKHGKIDEKENTYRIRQQEPSAFKKNSFRTIKFKEGIKAVIGCPKSK